jgi:chromosome segregation ATPase
VTDVALREYLERLIHETDRRYSERFAASDIALSKAETALREYKAGSNEWRDALKDANHRMATRAEVEKLDQQVQGLQRSRANLDGRIMTVSAIVSVIVGLLAGWLSTWVLG